MAALAVLAPPNRGHSPPSLPLAVTVKFEYWANPSGLHCSDHPTAPHMVFNQEAVLETPTSSQVVLGCDHKSQGMTLNKVVVNVGKKECYPGLMFVACSRVRRLADLLFVPPDRVANLGRKMSERLHEDLRLHCMSTGQPLPAPLPSTRPHPANGSNGEGNSSIPTSEPNVRGRLLGRSK